MELELQQQTLRGFHPVYHTLQGQEETLESIVPDAMPDIARIVSATGQVFLKEKEANEGSARITGTVLVSVLYIPEQEAGVRALTMSIPFQWVKDSPNIHAGMPLQTVLHSAFSDARMINPRKLLVRTNILCGLTVYDRSSEALTVDIVCGTSDRMEKKMTDHTCCSISEVAEKAFLFSDVLRPGASKPSMEELLYWRAESGASEGKVIGSKLVCKGSLQLQILYRSDTKLCRTEFELPYSQVMELTEEAAEGEAEVTVILRNVECRLQEGELEVSVEALLQSRIWTRTELNIVSDAYCNTACMDTEYASCELFTSAEQNARRETARQFCPSGIPGKEVLDCCVTVTELTVSGQDCAVQLNVEILYLSEDDALCGVSYIIPVSCSLPEGQSYYHACCPAGTATAVPVTGGLEVRAEVEFSWLTAKTTQVGYVSAVKAAPAGRAVEQPSVVIRLMREQETLWDIAKVCRSTVADICNANGLPSEYAPEGTVLLIPSRKL